MIICRIVAVVAVRRHLICEPSVNTFVKMRRFDLDQPAAQENGYGKNSDFRQTVSYSAIRHPDGITRAALSYQASALRFQMLRNILS